MSHTVVVVDDDPVVRAILQAVLTSGGYQVSTAADAAQGIEAVRREAPAAVLVDRVMPDRDGLELCRDIRADGGLPVRPVVVLLTADADRVPPDVAAAAGVDEVLAKPPEPAKLLARLAALVDGHGS